MNMEVAVCKLRLSALLAWWGVKPVLQLTRFQVWQSFWNVEPFWRGSYLFGAAAHCEMIAAAGMCSQPEQAWENSCWATCPLWRWQYGPARCRDIKQRCQQADPAKQLCLLPLQRTGPDCKRHKGQMAQQLFDTALICRRQLFCGAQRHLHKGLQEKSSQVIVMQQNVQPMSATCSVQ